MLNDDCYGGRKIDFGVLGIKDKGYGVSDHIDDDSNTSGLGLLDYLDLEY